MFENKNISEKLLGFVFLFLDTVDLSLATVDLSVVTVAVSPLMLEIFQH